MSSNCFLGLGQSPSRKSSWGYSWRQSLLRWPMPLHCQHMGHPGLMCLTPADCGSKSSPALTSLADGLTISFIASCLRVWLRAVSSILLPPKRRDNFTTQSLILLINIWAASAWIKHWGSPTRACWVNHLMVTVSTSGLLWTFRNQNIQMLYNVNTVTEYPNITSRMTKT